MQRNIFGESRLVYLALLLSGGLLSLCAVNLTEAQAQEKLPHPLKQDESCLACHGQTGMTSATGKGISIDAAKHAASVHGILGCTDCHSTIKGYPHVKKVEKVRCAACHTDEASNVSNSVHSALGDEACQSCHGDPHEVTAAQAAPVRCAQCHAGEVKEFRQGIHGQAAAAGDPDAPKCSSCHGDAHRMQASSAPASRVAKKNLAETCAACHSNQQFLARHRIPFARPVELYRLSVHGRAVAAGNVNAATCSDCHGSHGIFPSRDARSKVNHWNIAATCGQCHSDISKVYLESVHGQAMTSGVAAAPVCGDCHGEHLILGPKDQESLVNARRVSIVTCGRCHSDERLVLRFNLPADRVPSFADSYHGLALQAGSLRVANCASCHGVHNIFRSTDPRSTVNATNLPKTCGNCHVGAGDHFAVGPVHVQTSTGSAHPVVRGIRWIYWTLIPLTLGFMIVHNLLDFLSKLRMRRRQETEAQVPRMTRNFRIAHWGFIISFPTLVVTGFALKFPEAWWARPLMLWEGQFAFRGAVHRSAAIVLIASTVYHVVHLALNREDLLFLKAMLPRVKDATDLIGVFCYNLGLRKTEPHFARFNYAEKIEYWAFIWGTALMTLTGVLLWLNSFALRHFPKWVLDAATAVHYYEALLATFSVLLWHFYLVIFDPLVYPMNTAFLTGRGSPEIYRHSRPEYFRDLALAGTEQVSAVRPSVEPTAAESAGNEGNREVPKPPGSGPPPKT